MHWNNFRLIVCFLAFILSLWTVTSRTINHQSSPTPNLLNLIPKTNATGQCFDSNRTKCVGGVILGVWTPSDDISTIEQASRAMVYLLGMLYMFIGVSIVSDRFMASIEVITSQERIVKVKKTDGTVEKVSVRIWNETVSNLTLMALGSSAPEILLSVIEIWGKNFDAGELGPGTIVGSAAFNLFMIIGYCICVIPDNEVRRIKHFNVFLITGLWSMFAYLWLYLILARISPGIVEVWEALLTFMFFPLTVLSGYLADTKIFPTKFLKRRILKEKVNTFSNDGGDAEMKLRSSFQGLSEQHRTDDMVLEDGGKLTDEGLISQDEYTEFEKHRLEYIDIIQNIRRNNPNIDAKHLEDMAKFEILNRGPKSRAFYRIQATRALTGSGNVLRRKKVEDMDHSDLDKISEAPSRIEDEMTVQQVFFRPGHYTVLESVGEMQVIVARAGPNIHNTSLTVEYYTENGTAVAYDDYEPCEGRLYFPEGCREQQISIAIVDDDVFEEDEHFFVHLRRPELSESGLNVELTNPATATVMILDDDHPGVFHFDEETGGKVEISESVGLFQLKVVRSSGTRGHISVPYQTVPGNAEVGRDYQPISGYLEFHNDQFEAFISIPIVDNAEYEKNRFFLVTLGRPLLMKKLCDHHPGFQFMEDFKDRFTNCISTAHQAANNVNNHTDQLVPNHGNHIMPLVEMSKGGISPPPPYTEVEYLNGNGTQNPNQLKGQQSTEGEPRLGNLHTIEVHICESKELKNVVDHLMEKGHIANLLGTSSWKAQFMEALSVQYDQEDDEDNEEEDSPTISENNLGQQSPDARQTTPWVTSSNKRSSKTKQGPPLTSYLSHVITVFWKLIGAFIPPTEIWNGWLCFIVSILFIGVLTAVIGDLASGFGCTLGITDSVTAVIFVALGTSVPDTIASKVAAINDPTADSSIGNVLGSNAVNVYLGIGMAWLFAAIHHQWNGSQFRVDPGNLGFCVTMFCCLALIANMILICRRFIPSIRAELGGPVHYKYAASGIFVTLWAVYIVAIVLENYCIISPIK